MQLLLDALVEKFSDLCLCLFVWFIYTYKVMLQSWTHTQFTIWSKQKTAHSNFYAFYQSQYS